MAVSALSSLLALSMFGAGSTLAVTKDFKDVDKLSESSKEIIKKMQDTGVVGGYEDGTFRPKNSITRAEFATILVRALNLKMEGELKQFSDSKTEAWHYQALNIVHANGLFAGYGLDKSGKLIMKPNEEVDRLQTMLVLTRAYEANGYVPYKKDESDPSAYLIGKDPNEFTDFKDVPNWAKEDVKKAIQYKVTAGVSENKLGFKEKANREQAAIFASRTLDAKEYVKKFNVEVGKFYENFAEYMTFYSDYKDGVFLDEENLNLISETLAEGDADSDTRLVDVVVEIVTDATDRDATTLNKPMETAAGVIMEDLADVYFNMVYKAKVMAYDSILIDTDDVLINELLISAQSELFYRFTKTPEFSSVKMEVKEALTKEPKFIEIKNALLAHVSEENEASFEQDLSDFILVLSMVEMDN